MRHHHTRKGANCLGACALILGGLGLTLAVVVLAAAISPYICGLGALTFAVLAIRGALIAALSGKK